MSSEPTSTPKSAGAGQELGSTVDQVSSPVSPTVELTPEQKVEAALEAITLEEFPSADEMTEEELENECFLDCGAVSEMDEEEKFGNSDEIEDAGDIGDGLGSASSENDGL